VALRFSLEALPAVVAAFEGVEGELLTGADAPHPPALSVPEPVPAAAQLVADGLVDAPPVVPRGSRGAGETGYIRQGFRPELDELRTAARKGREWIAGLEARERERSGIPSLKVRFHPVHGYSLEVTKANLDRVPGDYERKQTLANAERFTTPELRDAERGVRGANERAAQLERETFEALRAELLSHGAAIRAAADAAAELDALAALAEVARRDGWTRPRVDDSLGLLIRAGRHPVVEPILAARGEEFVPNDAELDPDAAQILVLTGPNMSGKSTYLRQVALCVLLAQMGSFVPAESARIGVVDRVFTRVGASDRLARGESTFMVEMREAAEILQQASRRSLVILDEIGRGTSTFDGLSIAWAVAEYLHDTPGLGARTLFATHYHELTDLARTKPRVRNAHFQAREYGEEVVFMRRLAPGGASRSYGIQVARLAGLPPAVIERARGELDEAGRPRLALHADPALDPPDGGEAQLALFRAPSASPEEREVVEALRALDPDHTTPVDALVALKRLVERLRGAGGGS
jgi:DNA mismatch repair protein MutS